MAGSGEYRTTQCCRLKQIVAADPHQTAADEGDVAGRVKIQQQSHRIHEQYLRRIGHGIRTRVPRKGDLLAAQPLGDRLKAPWVPRHQHQERAGIRLAHHAMGSQYLLFFVLMGTARHPHGPLWRQLRAQPLTVGERAVRRREISLEIASDRNARRGHTQVGEAPGIGGCLCRDLHEHCQGPAQSAPQPAVAARGAFGKARTRQYQRHLGARTGSKQIRPDFRFQDDAQTRPHAQYKTPHGTRQVQRHIAHVNPGRLKQCARARQSRRGGRGDQQRQPRITLPQRRHQYCRGLHLADGRSMQPHRRRQWRAQSEALIEATPVSWLVPATPQQRGQIKRCEQVGRELEDHETCGACADCGNGACW